MISQCFEIKIGLLGHVSVGKTTGLNALLREKFSEVSMKRTTAGINFFRISSVTKSAKDAKLPARDDEESVDAQEENSTGSETSYAKASDTLQETTTDNARLRTTNELQEKIFDIELDEPLLKDMRDDTRLVLVDVPGINEAGTQKIYQDYVSSTWDTFDAMIVVMDAINGVNTDEQVGLLDFVKKNLDSHKDIPIIIVCNKVDDPDDDELMSLVKESRLEVESVFAVDDREKALQAIVDGEMEHQPHMSPAFLHVSFENAFLYRTASSLPMGDIKRLGKVCIDKIGHEEMGKFQWKRLSDEKKYELVYQIVSDPAQYKERFEATNFHKLLHVLQYFLGGKEAQEKLIQKQLDVALSKISIRNEEGQLFTDQLIEIFNRSKALGKNSFNLRVAPKFWALYKDLKAEALTKLQNNPTSVTALDEPMKELIKYAQNLQNTLIEHHPSITEENERKIVEAMKELIKRQIAIVIEKAGEWEPDTLVAVPNDQSRSEPAMWKWDSSRGGFKHRSSGEYYPPGEHPADLEESSWTYDDTRKTWKSRYSGREENTRMNPALKPYPPLSSWAGMSPKDWSTVVSSIMMIAHHEVFYETFGQEIANLEWMARHASFVKPPMHCFSCGHSGCFNSNHGKPLRIYHDYEKGTNNGSLFIPQNSARYDRVVQIKVPDSPSDPSHWGHLSWLFCKSIESLKLSLKTESAKKDRDKSEGGAHVDGADSEAKRSNDDEEEDEDDQQVKLDEKLGDLALNDGIEKPTNDTGAAAFTFKFGGENAATASPAFKFGGGNAATAAPPAPTFGVTPAPSAFGNTVAPVAPEFSVPLPPGGFTSGRADNGRGTNADLPRARRPHRARDHMRRLPHAPAATYIG